MKNNRLITAIALVFVISATVTSCRKYEDGPSLSLRTKTKRVANEWKLDSYYQDDVNKTDSLAVLNFSETFKNDGTYSRTYNVVNGDTVALTGTWDFADKKETLAITGVDSMFLSPAYGYVPVNALKILRLQNDELWYAVEKNGIRHEFHLVTK